jgi:stage II sporulation protein P
VLGRLFGVYLVLCVVAAGAVWVLRQRSGLTVPASAPAEPGPASAPTLVQRVGDALERVLDLVRPAAARGRNLPSDDDRLRSFGDKLLRAVLDTMGGLDPSDPRTMLRAELPVLVQANMPQPASDAPVLDEADRVELSAAAVPVEPWTAERQPLDSPGRQDQQDQQDQGRAVLAISSGRSGTSQAATSAAATLPSTSASTSVSSPQRLSGGAPAPRASASLAPRVAVLHTHSSEAYRASQGSDYRWGKTDGVVRIGAVLAEELEKAGIKCVHSTKVHDYPDWTKSYAQSAATLRSILEKNPQIEAVIDVHRDSLPSGSESLRVATVAGQKVARVMFVVADNSSGLSHPNWRNNYAFALKVSAALDKIAPGVSRGVAIHKGGRFNQHMHEHAIIVEIGGTTNTLEEATRAAKLVAQAIAMVL